MKERYGVQFPLYDKIDVCMCVVSCMLLIDGIFVCLMRSLTRLRDGIFVCLI